MPVKKQQAEIFIEAPVRQVYNFITDWRNTPRYERLVTKIERVGLTNEKSQCLADSYISLLGLRLRFLYRYRFVPPTRYGGVQIKGLVRGGFWFELTETNVGTHVVHGEFITSRWKVLETLISVLLSRVLFPADLEHQLRKLKKLVESNNCTPCPQSESHWRPG